MDGRARFGEYLPAGLAAVGLLGVAMTFVFELDSFREAVVDWARRDLATRTDLTAERLREPIETGDFGAIRAVGERCSSVGMRMTVYTAPGGILHDSRGPDETLGEEMSETRPCGDCRVRLALPIETVLAPFRRARHGFVLAALIGGMGVLLVFFATYRQRVRIRELAKLEKFRREFVSDVSHEFKTPLAGIIGAVDLLTEGGGGEDAAMRERLLPLVRREATRLNVLAQDIVSLARLERDGETVDATACDLRAVVAEAVDSLRVEAERKGVKLSFAAEGETLRSAKCDPALVARAVTNLVSNAIRHSGSPEVTVELRRSATDLRLVVSDRGCGIAPEHARRIFERFYRVDAARSDQTGGSGLGLAIVRRIARLHGGDVTYEPSRPHGSTFVLFLPQVLDRSA